MLPSVLSFNQSGPNILDTQYITEITQGDRRKPAAIDLFGNLGNENP